MLIEAKGIELALRHVPIGTDTFEHIEPELRHRRKDRHHGLALAQDLTAAPDQIVFHLNSSLHRFRQGTCSIRLAIRAGSVSRHE